MHNDIEVISRSTGILSNQAFRVGFIYCSLQLKLLIPEFASNVDIGSLCAHTKAYNKRTFNQLVWVVTKDLSVLASARLRLIRVDNQVGWSAIEENY